MEAWNINQDVGSNESSDNNNRTDPPRTSDTARFRRYLSRTAEPDTVVISDYLDAALAQTDSNTTIIPPTNRRANDSSRTRATTRATSSQAVAQVVDNPFSDPTATTADAADSTLANGVGANIRSALSWSQYRTLRHQDRLANGLPPLEGPRRLQPLLQDQQQTLLASEEQAILAGLIGQDDTVNMSSDGANSIISSMRNSGGDNLTLLAKLHLLSLRTNLGASYDADTIAHALSGLNPRTCLLYVLEPSPTGSDVWPDIRDFSKTPARLTAMSSHWLSSQARRAGDARPSANAMFDQEANNIDESIRSTRASAPLLRAAMAQVPILRQLLTSNDNNAQSEPMSTHVDMSNAQPMMIIPNDPARRPTWPQDQPLLPNEMYSMILSHLSRDDIKSLRLTCKEIELRISSKLFETVVVPFNTEIYGMLQGIKSFPSKKAPGKNKGKGKMKETEETEGIEGGKLVWKNLATNDVYNGHGIDVFRGFGPHMKKFGMSFEVDEEVLSALPRKELLQLVKTYWGEYEWPYPDYQRFKEIARLENTADETPLMVKAFSYLTIVEELAISIDSGLGWLHGPDTSLHTRIFKKPPPVFGNRFPVPDRRSEAQKRLWELLHKLSPTPDGDSIAGSVVRHRLVPFSKEAFELIHRRNVALEVEPPTTPLFELRSLLDFDRHHDELGQLSDIIHSGAHNPSWDTSGKRYKPKHATGILSFEDAPTPEDSANTISPLQPNNLTKPQKEWLLETEWAQRAFISSYMLAIMDNAFAFKNVHTFNFSRISTHYISQFFRDDFWDSIPNLKNLTVLAIQEWQMVVKDEAGYVDMKKKTPSTGCCILEELLTDYIAPRRNIKYLNIGWAAGGEHESGAYGRNQQLAPCPLMPWAWLDGGLSDLRLLKKEMILLPSVEHLTLTNCWIAGVVLQLLVKKQCAVALQKLTLDSVSLSGHKSGWEDVLSDTNLPDPPAPGNVPPAPPPPPPLGHVPGMPLQFGHLPAQAGAANPVPGQVQMTAQAAQAAGIFGANAMQLAQALQPNLFANQPVQNHMQHRAQALAANFNAIVAAAPLNNGQQPNANNNPRGVWPQRRAAHLAAVPPAAAAGEDADSWKGPHRTGSWPYVIDSISPGLTLATVPNAHPARTVLPADHHLTIIEFKSCGYAHLVVPNVDFDMAETVVNSRAGSALIRRAMTYCTEMMPGNRDHLLGQVSQYLPWGEDHVLRHFWGFRVGWEDQQERLAAYYDGFQYGGTGRFSGVLEKIETVVGDEEE
ncbi:hypothetical protein BT63DRAFT_421808 [Microthyrium microscopicum]|uniref:F-box domain-containing protein n=1 Tax=Microthyrium microscopicum TaxID=703497 RepID=A0A6A6UN65_9PEZI|nr:hypothetical protein BT63DRAFT_421808 [Microthyrium microscopicum]